MTNRIEALPSNRLIAEYSLWSANLLNLQHDLDRIAGHADMMHIDVADGHFAPALLFFPDLVAAIKNATQAPLHVHIMVDASILLAQVKQFAEAGADLISVHVENGSAIAAVFDYLESKHIAKGIVLNVATPVASIEPLLPRLDVVTLLGTAIGVKGQNLNEQAPQRLTQAKALIAKQKRRIILAADGGIREHTVPVLRQAGAETVVLGSLAFGAPDLAARMQWLKAL